MLQVDVATRILNATDPTGNFVRTKLVGSLANDKETLTIDNTVGGISLTPAKYGTNTKAFITVENASIRYWINGSAPTVSEGHLLNAGDALELDSNSDIANFKAIRTTGVSATIQCTYSA